MPDYQYDDDGDDDEQQGGGMQDLRKQLRAKDKELKELREKYTAIETTTRKRTATEVLTERGAKPGYARFLIADGVDPSDKAAVDSWVNENSDLLGLEVQQAEAPSDEEVEAADRQERILAPRGRGGDSIEKKLQEVRGFGPDDRAKFDAWIKSQQGSAIA